MNMLAMRTTTTLTALTLLLSAGAALAATTEMKHDIVDTAAKTSHLSTLVKAVKAADLVDTLKGKGPYTLFAPTDKAFAKLPKGTLENLLKPENKEQLKKILTYHVVPGDVTAADAMKLTKATTVEGGDMMIKTVGKKVMINDATVVKADIKASNGVIHEIDTVLMPK